MRKILIDSGFHDFPKSAKSIKKLVLDQGDKVRSILDCPTRWNSLVFMLSRFCTIKTAVQKAMIDLKVPMSMSEVDCIVAEEIVSTLEPVTLVVNALSRRAINLISADAAVQFCITQLLKQKSDIAKTMVFRLECRVTERCAPHSAVLHYLHNNEGNSSYFDPMPSVSTIKKLIERMLLRLDKLPEGMLERVETFHIFIYN